MANYINKLYQVLDCINFDSEDFQQASSLVSKTLNNDGIIYLFGCGHSHMFGEELFYRAGGLANVRPIFHYQLMLHDGAAHASECEKKNGYAQSFITKYNFTAKDIVFVISTSGINPVPIDVAIYAKQAGAKVITISSFNYPKHIESRHSDNIYLKDVGHLNINNYVPYGDAVVGTTMMHSPVSTIVGMSILHEIIASAIEANSISDIPIFISGNIENSAQHNLALLQQYGAQIPELINNIEKMTL